MSPTTVRATQQPPSLRPANKTDPPTTFRSAIYRRLDNPYTSLFRLGIRILQLVFALGPGVCYAIELSHGSHASHFVYAQVVFGLTLVILIVHATTVPSYRLTFLVEWTLCILWLALFGVFYVIYVDGRPTLEPDAVTLDVQRMKAAVWMDLVSCLLWMGSAMFATVLWCSGARAWIRRGTSRWRRRRACKDVERLDGMEEGVLSKPTEANKRDHLPQYEEVIPARG